MNIGTKNENNIAIILLVAQHNPYTARVLYVEQRVKFNVKRKTFSTSHHSPLVLDPVNSSHCYPSYIQ
jgi:hypothetical protein